MQARGRSLSPLECADAQESKERDREQKPRQDHLLRPLSVVEGADRRRNDRHSRRDQDAGLVAVVVLSLGTAPSQAQCW